MEEKKNFLEGCLFFNTNALSRHLLKLAENQFRPLGLSPAHASMMLLVFNHPGSTPKQLAGQLCLTPSTITRFINALLKKGLIRRKTQGKTAHITPTAKGLALKKSIAGAYKNLYAGYTHILGEETALQLSAGILSAAGTLADHFNSQDD